MSFVYKCEKCGDIYEHGFTGTWSKVVRWGSKSFDVEVRVRPPHQCNKCLDKFLPLLVKEIKGSYNG